MIGTEFFKTRFGLKKFGTNLECAIDIDLQDDREYFVSESASFVFSKMLANPVNLPH